MSNFTPGPSSGSGTPTSRIFSTAAPLQGGGDLSSDRSFSILSATTSSDGILSSNDKNKINNMSYQYLFGLLGTTVANVTRFLSPGAGTLILGEYQIPIPVTGTLRNLKVRALTGPGIGLSDNIIVRVTGSNSLLAAALVGTGAQNSSNISSSISVRGNDLISVSLTSVLGSVLADLTVSFELFPS